MSEMGMFNHVPKPDEVAAKAFSMSRDEQEQWSWPSYCCGLSDGGVCDARVAEIMIAAMNGEFSHNTEQAFSGEPSPMHDHIEQLEDENDKLREQVTQLQGDWESERDYADQMEAKERKAVSENDELRELVRGLYWCNDKKWNKGACDDCPIRGRAVGRCERAMRKLGIEVDA